MTWTVTSTGQWERFWLLVWHKVAPPLPSSAHGLSYLCSGRINQKDLNSDSVADVQLRELIDQVESATEHSMMIGLSDEILNCGYTGNVSIPNKYTIVRAIILHALLRLQPMLEQLREGLQLYGLLSLMSQYPDICQPLFVSGEDVKVNAEFVMASILPQLSDKGTTRHQVELEMMNFIQDFLYEAEDHGHVDKDGLHPITPATLLQWITGQGHVPLLPSEKKDFAVVIQFNHDLQCRLWASQCLLPCCDSMCQDNHLTCETYEAL
ncbi:uncharacterized protein [Pseudochaenichthys georgianus]|uniref:uncharacterized protein n=1 Tax=Pseudochaenichthys georgianus TaxID=52239 RepID=UPI0039C316A6